METRNIVRRTFAAAVVALSAAVATLPAAPGTASGSPADSVPGSGDIVGESQQRILSRAQRVLESPARATTPAVNREDASLVLRELFEALPRLEGDDRALAETLLARPTDGARDPQGRGYTTGSVKKCKPNVCLHWVKTTADAPPSDAWAMKSLRMLTKVYRFEVGKLGYRRPVPDRRVGGNSKFDVYLKDLGAGLYGYCVPEYYKPGSRKVASGYCVIDNDFSRSQFSGRPTANLKVTLAHEFFHAIQFAYDFTDDPWLYESTAVWMEERFADKVDDNRQYLPIGQVRRGHVPLDTFAEPGYHYGNWAWWEYLSRRFGNGIVKQVWSRVDANKGKPDMYSTKALKRTLKSKGGFTKLFAAYAGGNTIPARTYPEGRHWPSAAISGSDRLGKADRRATFRTTVDHMSSRSFVVKPDRSLRGNRWRLRITIKGPRRSSAPAAYLVVRTKGGKVSRKAIPLSRKGRGKVKVGFNRRRTKSATITVANTSTRFRCRQGTNLSCRGTAKDDDRPFAVKASVFR
jgi:hypothetical protein